MRDLSGFSTDFTLQYSWYPLSIVHISYKVCGSPHTYVHAGTPRSVFVCVCLLDTQPLYHQLFHISSSAFCSTHMSHNLSVPLLSLFCLPILPPPHYLNSLLSSDKHHTHGRSWKECEEDFFQGISYVFRNSRFTFFSLSLVSCSFSLLAVRNIVE